MGLYQKYRPQKFEDVIGQDKAVKALLGLLEGGGTLPSAFLFHGPHGCGKTTLGRLVAKFLGCSKADYKELDTADFRGIDSMREIRRTVNYAPMDGDVRVWLLDECHQITKDGQDALLKALEDPPPHAFFILCTTEPEKLRPTIRSRCSDFGLGLLSDKDIGKILVRACKGEKKRPPMDVIKHIARGCNGSGRVAMVALEKVINLPEDEMLEVAECAVIEQQKSVKLANALLKNAPWKTIAGMLRDTKDDPERTRIGIRMYMRAILIKGPNDRAAEILETFHQPYHYTPTAAADLVEDCWAVTNG